MFHEMRYVYAVYQEQSFSKAAEKLYISQPSLSAMVKRAEKRIGSDIFNRSTIPVTLTQTGEAYIAAVEKIMELETELRRQINIMHKLRMNGFFMHARGGLETEYLGEDWYDCIRACVDEAEKLGMEA